MSRIPDLTTLTLLLAAAFTPACKSERIAPSKPAATAPAAAPKPTATHPAPTVPAPTVTTTPPPLGPGLLVMPGKGLGPIRFGATFPTIERLMEAPCEVKTDVLCRYITRAVDYTMKDGALTALHVHSWLRPVDPANPKLRWGMFNGGLLPDLRLGMLAWAIQEKLGPPKRVEKVTGKGSLEELHYYAGMVLEYDRIPNNNVVLSGIRMDPKM